MEHSEEAARLPTAALAQALRLVVLDMASSERATYGEQEGSTYNGYFGCTCDVQRLGDLERSALRPGNVHGADGWREVLEPVIATPGAR